MRFVVTGEWRDNRLLALVIIWFLVFGIGVWLTNLLLYLDQMGLTYASVVAHYRGNEGQYHPSAKQLPGSCWRSPTSICSP